MVITIANQKGGVGKTTAAVSLAVCLAEYHKKRTLLIDMDSQGHTGVSLGITITEGIATAYEIISGKREPAPYQRGRYLHVWPGARDMDDLDTEFMNKPIGHHLLREALAKVHGQYDAVIIDTPPDLDLPTLNAFTAATHFLVPVEPGFLSVDGMAQLLREIEAVKKYTNPDLQMIGVVLQKADPRTILPAETVRLIREAFEDLHVLEAIIPDAIAVAEAPGFGMSIFDYQPKSRAAQAYRSLAKEVLSIVETTYASGQGAARSTS